MSKGLSLFWVAWLLPMVGLGEVDSLWSRTYGGAEDDMFKVLIKTQDDGYALIGETNSFGDGHIWLLKIDADYDSLWSRTYYGGGRYERPVDAIQTADGGYAILARHFERMLYCWLIKTDSLGNEEWGRMYNPHGFDDSPKSLLQTTDGGFILTGHNSTFIEEHTTFVNRGWLIKTDSLGNEEWVKNTDDWDYPFRGTQYFVPADIIQVDTVLVMGGNLSYFSGDTLRQDIALVKSNQEGEYFYYYDQDMQTDDEEARFIFQVSDTSYGMGGQAGNVNGGPSGNWPYFTLAVDGRYNSWTEVLFFGDQGGLYDAIKEGDRFITVGGGGNGITLVEFPYRHNRSLFVNYGGENSYLPPYSIANLDDGEYIVFGTTNSMGSGGYDFLLMRLGIANRVRSRENQKPEGFKIISVYPNPFNSTARIDFTLSKPELVNFTVYNSLGQSVQGLSGLYQSGNNHLNFNGFNLPSGVYFARVETSQFNRVYPLYLIK